MSFRHLFPNGQSCCFYIEDGCDVDTALAKLESSYLDFCKKLQPKMHNELRYWIVYVEIWCKENLANNPF